MEDVLKTCRPFTIKPKCFFVAWSGVLTLVYEGFPPQLEELKGRLDREFRALPAENPGSLWPKTSLGALQDHQRLTPDQLATLNSICREASNVFPSETEVAVDCLSVAVYECRSLERLVSIRRYQLEGDLDSSEPNSEERRKASEVVEAALRDEYWFHASRDGNRAQHYTCTPSDISTSRVVSVWDRSGYGGNACALPFNLYSSRLSQVVPPRLQHVIVDACSRFRAEVDAALPGMYRWFDSDSLHLTVRALIT